MRVFSVAAAFGVVVALTLSPSARAQQQQAPRMGINPQMKQALGITSAQEAKMNAVQQKYFGKAQELSKQAMAKRQKLTADQEALLTPAQKAKMKALGTKFQSDMQGLQQQAIALQKAMMQEMDAILTPAQRAKAKQMQAAQMGGGTAPAPH